MAKIPSAASITRNTGSGQRGITSINLSGAVPTSIGTALTKLKDNRDKYQATKAEADFLSLKNEQDNAYDRDDDYGTITERYGKTMDEGLSKIAMGISNPAAREEFMLRGNLRINQGRTAMDDLSFGKESDFERSSITESLSRMRDNSITGTSENVTESRDTAFNLIDTAKDMGYYDNEQALSLKTNWKTDTAVGRLKTMRPAERLEALKMPWAKDLPADTRTQLQQDAEKGALAQTAVDTVDQYMINDYDMGEGLDAAGKIKDEATRTAVEKRFLYMYDKKQSIETEKRSETFDKYYIDVRQGNITVDDIPSSEFKSLSPTQQNNLFDTQSASVGAKRTVSDRSVIDNLNGLKASGEFRQMREYFMANSDKLNDTAFNTWSKVSQTGDAPVEVESLFTVQDRMDNKLNNARITDDYAKSELSESLSKWYMNYQSVNGKMPNDVETDKQIDRLLLEFDTRWSWGGTKPIFKMNEAETKKTFELAQEEDPELFKSLQEKYAARGVDPAPEMFLDAYRRARENNGK